jgi:A/G-specific adenine glycosylase
VAGLVLRRGRALAVRRPEQGLLAGLWELPGGELRSGERAADALERTIGERVGLRLAESRALGVVEHGFTHLSLRLHVFRCSADAGRVRLRGFTAHRWLAPPELRALPQGGPTRKALALAFGGAA